jgi:hypothetical protein
LLVVSEVTGARLAGLDTSVSYDYLATTTPIATRAVLAVVVLAVVVFVVLRRRRR